MTIDPITMARFLVMPGAPDLLDAFSRIPEGPLREATIAQVRAMADAYAPGPAAHATDPLHALAAPEPPAAPAPPRRRGKMGVEEQVIARRMEGEWPSDVAKELGMTSAQANTILNRARAAGIEFPPLSRRHPAADVAPPPAAPPADLVLPRTPKAAFPVPFAEMDKRLQTVTRKSAEALGLSVEEYQALQREAVRRRAAGEYPIAIAEALNLSRHQVTLWCANAQTVGVKLPPLLSGSGARVAMGRTSGLHGSALEKAAANAARIAQEAGDGVAVPNPQPEADEAPAAAPEAACA